MSNARIYLPGINTHCRHHLNALDANNSAFPVVVPEPSWYYQPHGWSDTEMRLPKVYTFYHVIGVKCGCTSLTLLKRIKKQRRDLEAAGILWNGSDDWSQGPIEVLSVQVGISAQRAGQLERFYNRFYGYGRGWAYEATASVDHRAAGRKGGLKGGCNQPREAKAKGGRKGIEKLTHEARVKGGCNQPREAKAKGGHIGGCNGSREAKARAGRNGAKTLNAMRRKCPHCDLMTNPGALAGHIRAKHPFDGVNA
jgi:hypothetical protein